MGAILFKRSGTSPTIELAYADAGEGERHLACLFDEKWREGEDIDLNWRTEHRLAVPCVDFILEAYGDWLAEELPVGWDDSELMPPLTEDQERIWEEERRRASQGGEQLWDGQLCRLLSFHQTAGRLSLVFAPTSYKELVVSNLKGEGPKTTDNEDQLSNGTAVCCVLRSVDGKLLVGQRNRSVHQHSEWWHVCGGHIDPSDQEHRAAGEGKPSPSRAMMDELSAELGLVSEEIDGLHCTGIVRDLSSWKPELTFWAQATIRAQEILDRARRAKEQEATWHALEDSAQAVEGFLQERSGRVVPVGKAALLLYVRLIHEDFSWMFDFVDTERAAVQVGSEEC